MYYNFLRSPSVSRMMQSAFGGLNRNARISDNEFADMLNMTGDHVPLLAPRKRRTVVQRQIVETVTVTEVDEEGNENAIATKKSKTLNGILGDAGFCAVWDGDFYYMGEKVEGISLANGEKKIVAMGANILIFPDAVYYNIFEGSFGRIDAGTTGKDVTGSRWAYAYIYLKDGTNRVPCNIKTKDGTTVTSISILSSHVLSRGVFVEGLPETMSILANYYVQAYKDRYSITNGKLYYIFSTTETATKEGNNIRNTYTDIVWKEVPIEKVVFPSKISTSSFATLSAMGLEGKTNLWCGDVFINPQVYTDDYVTGLAFAGHSAFSFAICGFHEGKNLYAKMLRGSAIAERTLPVFDYVCVHDNRLWGCRFGTQINGATDCNEIYCSSLGDFKNWTTGTGADNAFSFSVGEYGKWTGCVSLRGQLLFFKEGTVYRVTGEKPSNFSSNVISDNGLQEGCEKTLEVIDNILYYKSKSGVYVYDGSVPYKISDALGSGFFENAVAGKHIDKYYISMVQDGARKLYVYDTRTKLWHAEDAIYARFFTEYEGALYAGVDNDIVCLVGEPASVFSDTEREEAVEWSVQTGDIGLDSPYPKYYRRVLIRMDMEFGARVTVELACDGGDWLQAADFESVRKQSFLMPIVTPRCDHMRIRIRGKGDVKIYSISYETETTGGTP